MRTISLGLASFTFWLIGSVVAVAAPSPAGSNVALNNCVSACNRASLKEDDRATCKLECRYLHESAAPASPPAAPAATPPVAPAGAATPAPAASATSWSPVEIQRCQSRCDASASENDRATCRLQCQRLTAPAAPSGPPQGAAASSPPSGAPYTPTGVASAGGPVVYSPTQADAQASAQAVYAAQIEQQRVCVSECQRQAFRSPTDLETCKLTCQSLVEAPSERVYFDPNAAGDARSRVIQSSGGVAGAARPSAQASWYAPYEQGAPTSSPTITPPPGAAAAPPAPMKPVLTPEAAARCSSIAAACAQGCVSSRAACSSDCDATNKLATDRATCRLLCDGNQEVCQEGCGARSMRCNAGEG